MRKKGQKEKLELWNLKVKLFLYLLKLKSWNIQLTNMEDTDSLVIETVKKKMGFDISSADIDKTEIYFDWHCGVILRSKKLKSGFLQNI